MCQPVLCVAEAVQQNGASIGRQLLHIFTQREGFRRREGNQHAAAGGAPHLAGDGLACCAGLLGFQLRGFFTQAASDRDNGRDGDESRRHIDSRGQPPGWRVERDVKSFDHAIPSPRTVFFSVS